MHKFLEDCARYVYSRFHADLKNITIVFPNRRSGVFFSAYLRKQLVSPVIGPTITTVNELLQTMSPLIPAEKLRLITILHEVFRNVTGSTESLDEFYFWGEVLLADFDDIDKYLINAKDLFQNIAGLKDIEHHFDYLTEEQKATLQRFWGSLGSWKEWEHERKFVTVWEKLFEVYDSFRNELRKVNAGYPGMIMRDGVENYGVGTLTENLTGYIFIGLNALHACEKHLFARLQMENKAVFLWDYDSYYVDNPVNDAGKFLRENLSMFPAPDDFSGYNHAFRDSKTIRIISVPSLTGQSQILPAFFQQHAAAIPEEGDFDNTALVLADESLLFPVLGAIPQNIANINVTMGYPVKDSPVAGFLSLLSALLRNTRCEIGEAPRFYYKFVTDILNHPLLVEEAREKTEPFLKGVVAGNKIYLSPEELQFSDIHSLVFRVPDSVAGYPDYFLGIMAMLYRKTEAKSGYMVARELISQVYVALERMFSAIREVRQELSPAVFFKILNQYIGKVSVPFEGEPLSGLQVMGILETRCLDFDNVVILGLNEEVWPRTGAAPSMIPYHLRKAFGLPGMDDQDAMYAYYFYRLIQRARRVTATWNTIREGLSGGELSRYGFQLMMLSPHKVHISTFDYPFVNRTSGEIVIPSGEEITRKLLAVNNSGKALSPSAINTWLGCTLRFYFRYVLNIEEPEEVAEEIDRRIFGNIFHKAVENLYASCSGKLIVGDHLSKMLKDRESAEMCVRRAFATEFFKVPEEEAGSIDLQGKARLIYTTILSYIVNLIELDKAYAPLRILSLEKGYYTTFQIQVGNDMVPIVVGGKIDRLDEVDGVLRVIDYKTGNLESRDLSFRTMEELTDTLSKTRKKEVVQALIYSLVLKRDHFSGHKISALIYPVLKLSDTALNPQIRRDGQEMEIGEIRSEWESSLIAVLEQIYSPAGVFRQTQYKERCRYCPYRQICMR